MLKELEKIKNTMESEFEKSDKRVKEIENTEFKEFDAWANEKSEINGLSPREIYNECMLRRKQIPQQLANLKDTEKELKLSKMLADAIKFCAEYEAKKNEMIKDPTGYSVQKKEERAKIIAEKLQESFDVLESKIEQAREKVAEIVEEIKNNPEDNDLLRDLSKARKELNNLVSERNVVSRLQNYDGVSYGFSIESELLDGLKDEKTREFYRDYYELIKANGNVTIGGKKPIDDDEEEPIKPGDDDDDKEKDPPEPDPIPPRDIDIDINHPEVQVPKNIGKKPDKTWKTVLAVALGAGVAIGAYAAFGVAGTGIVMAVSGIGRTLIKRQEKKLSNLEAEAMGLLEGVNQIDQKNQMLFAKLQELNQERAALKQDEEGLKRCQEIDSEMNQIETEIAQNKDAISKLQADAKAIFDKVSPDLKAEQYKGPQKITSIQDAKDKIKAKANKFKAYIGSKEGLRDARWLSNSAFLTSAGLTVSNMVATHINSVTTPVNTPAQPAVSPSTAPTTGGLEGLRAGGSVDGYNLSVGHDTASWAVSGTNSEHLIGQYVNGQNSIFESFGVADAAGRYHPFDLGNMSLGEFLKLHPEISPENVVTKVVRGTDHAGQAWVSVPELLTKTAELGGRSI